MEVSSLQQERDGLGADGVNSQEAEQPANSAPPVVSGPGGTHTGRCPAWCVVRLAGLGASGNCSFLETSWPRPFPALGAFTFEKLLPFQIYQN